MFIQPVETVSKSLPTLLPESGLLDKVKTFLFATDDGVAGKEPKKPAEIGAEVGDVDAKKKTESKTVRKSTISSQKV